NTSMIVFFVSSALCCSAQAHPIGNGNHHAPVPTSHENHNGGNFNGNVNGNNNWNYANGNFNSGSFNGNANGNLNW
ncbi:MAG: hypothetical protein ACTHNE_10505, partial [Dyella sp.]